MSKKFAFIATIEDAEQVTIKNDQDGFTFHVSKDFTETLGKGGWDQVMETLTTVLAQNADAFKAIAEKHKTIASQVNILTPFQLEAKKVIDRVNMALLQGDEETIHKLAECALSLKPQVESPTEPSPATQEEPVLAEPPASESESAQEG